MSGDDVERHLRETIRFKEESEAFLSGVIIGSFAVLAIGVLKELIRSVGADMEESA